jgi:mono/diheme cytochrome c family protein
VTVEVAPARDAPATRTLVFDQAARQQKTWFDVQDGYEHNLRGVSLADLIARARAPKTVDAVVFTYSDGMVVPVRLDQKDEVNAIFVALEHGNVRDQFTTTYTLHDGSELPCPKIVYGRKVKEYSTWIYPAALSSIRLVNWRAYEAYLAQPTRQLPDRTGWPIYLAHCQNCHGIGGLGAKRGPDFLTDMEAYRRIPPFAVTDVSQHPSLHEKVKGFAEGKMPVLTQVSNQDIATLWRWLHAIHKAGTK